MPTGIPEGFHALSPYLSVGDAAGAIEFYEEVFGATQLLRMDRPDGKVLHAEIRIADSTVMLVDEPSDFPQMRSPKSLGGSPVHLFLYTEDAEATFERAVAAGARAVMAVEYFPEEGDRRGGIEDPFGFTWWIATHEGNVSREEMQSRHDERRGGVE